MNAVDTTYLKSLIARRAAATDFNEKAFAERLERSAALNNIDFERFLTLGNPEFVADANRIWRDQVPTCLIPPPTREEQLEKALRALLIDYADLMRSGDYGGWTTESEVMYRSTMEILESGK